MQFDWWTFAFQVVNVLVLAWILGRFFFNPLASVIATRKETISQALHDAEQTRRKSEEAMASLAAERQALESERSDLLEKAREEARKQQEQLLEDARSQAAALVSDAGKKAERAQKEAQRQELERAARLAGVIAGRVLLNIPSDARIAGYAERLAQAVSALDERKRSVLSSDADKLELVAARQLKPAELKEAREAIAGVAAKGANVPVVIDAELIAGIELRGPHVTVHNSIRHDLERVREALANEAEA